MPTRGVVSSDYYGSHTGELPPGWKERYNDRCHMRHYWFSLDDMAMGTTRSDRGHAFVSLLQYADLLSIVSQSLSACQGEEISSYSRKPKVQLTKLGWVNNLERNEMIIAT